MCTKLGVFAAEASDLCKRFALVAETVGTTRRTLRLHGNLCSPRSHGHEQFGFEAEAKTYCIFTLAL